MISNADGAGFSRLRIRVYVLIPVGVSIGIELPSYSFHYVAWRSSAHE